jgi:hypothetical protein
LEIEMSEQNIEPVTRLTKDLANASATMTAGEARFLVDSYYSMQEDRIRSNNQVRALGESEEPHDVLRWLADQSETLENQIKRSLAKYVEAHPVGGWLMSVVGIGPVIAAGLLAHIDIHKAPTTGHIWRFAGLDPTMKWEKGQKRPFNAKLKVVCWKAGESFVKVSGNENALYGQFYAERKKLEMERNEALAFKAQAENILATKKIGKTTDAYAAYSVGKLPPAHIHARAKRYAVKLFLAHLHDVWYRIEFKKDPPKPYVIEHLGHAHWIRPVMPAAN